MNPSLDNIRSFLAVAELKSFSAAAMKLGVTPTAVSKAVRQLEQQHGVLLFVRNTRSVALSEAGAGLYGALASASTQIDDAFAALTDLRDRPAGKLRLTVPRALGALVMQQVLPAMRRDFPQVLIDLSLDDGAVDLIAEGFDAGIRLGQSVAQDMVAVRLTGELAWSVVGAPAYFDRAGTPQTPAELVAHDTLGYRFHRSGALHRWRFIDPADGAEFTVDGAAKVVVNDTTMIASLASAGLGLAYLADIEIDAALASGQLRKVLTQWTPRTSGLYLYFPARTQRQPKLRALIDTASAVMRATAA
jgi:DNA-binding transcriptional LysR family regulator